MNCRTLGSVALGFVAVSAVMVQNASGSFLGTAQSFGVVAGTTVTGNAATTINGNLGLWPNNAVTGFPPGVVNGTMYLGDSVAQQAWDDVSTAYNMLEAMSFNQNLSGQDLGGLTLTAGVYMFSSSAQLTGTITLDGQGDPNALFVFQIGSTLTTAGASSVNLINGADGCNVYWQVGSSATLGTTTDFFGSILARASITMTTGATITEGSALALDGAVTMDSNTITVCTDIPAPAASMLLGAVVGLRTSSRRRKA